MKGDILACYGSDTLSELVEKVTRSNVAHIAVQISDKYMMESGYLGVKLSKISRLGGQYFILRDNALTETQRQQLVDKVVDSVDILFDYKQFLGIGLNKLFGLHLTWDDKAKYVCDELAISAYRDLFGIELCPGIPDSEIAPGDLLKSERFIILKSDGTLL